ncbi:MAG TPA: SPOR domain-containing protein [Spirochaetales bacterium]|nr:SPOR domain-containing protein [Spirochaetales bacterium]
MPLETRKVLWISLSVLILVLATTGVGMILFMPKAGQAAAPVSIAGSIPPRATAPETYVRSYEPAPAPVAESTASGDSITIIYGSKPDASAIPSADTVASGTTGTVGTALTPSASDSVASKPYMPAPSGSSPVAAAKPVSPAPVVSVKPAAVSVAPKPTAPKTYTEYWIQAGSFTSRSRAEDLQRDLAAKGLSSVITVKDIDGTSYFPVRVGPYTAKKEADGWLGKVRALPGCSEAYVSQVSVTR